MSSNKSCVLFVSIALLVLSGCGEPDVTAGQAAQTGRIQSALSYGIKGIVTDGSGHGWPLYARVAVSASGFAGATVYTDPATGTYAVSLPEGVTYTFTVMSNGYQNSVRSVSVASGIGDQDFQMSIADGCTAPGYRRPAGYIQGFEGTGTGFTSSGSNSTWKLGIPTTGPGSAHSGMNVIATNLDGRYGDEDSHMQSPTINLSASAGKTLLLSWWQWLDTDDQEWWCTFTATITDGPASRSARTTVRTGAASTVR
ncbi:MAG: hypothetical protein WC889_16945 [Myxococcota bacterium]